MQLSRFVVRYLDVQPDEHVLYDVLGDRYVGVDGATLGVVDEWTGGRAPAGQDELETAAALAEAGFLVDGRATDDARLRAHLEEASEGVRGELYVTLMPTLRCNLACSYCFQKEHPAFTRMKDDVEDATHEWILRKLDASACRVLRVHYFGGEPMTRKDYLLRSAELLQSAMRARGGTFAWELTTNGIGCDLAFVTAMNAHGEGSIKFTLDGDKPTHDAVRVYRDGRGTFDEIFANALAIAPHVRLRIGGNFLPEQAPSYEALLDRIEASGLARHLEMVRFKPIVDSELKQLGCGSCADKTSPAETAALVQLTRSVQRRGLDGAHDAADRIGACELHWKHSYTIDPEGRVYKCPAVAGRAEMAVADVRAAAETPEKVAPLVALRPWRECGDCPYLPVCVGGCLAASYLETGRLDRVFCKKQNLEALYRDSVLRRYHDEFGGNDAVEAA